MLCIIKEYSAQALRNLAIDSTDNAAAILAADGLPPLVQLLGGGVLAKVQEQAAGVIANIASAKCSLKATIEEMGAIPRLIQVGASY